MAIVGNCSACKKSLDFLEDLIGSSPCGHFIHSECLDKLFTSRKNNHNNVPVECPSCKFKFVRGNFVKRLYPDVAIKLSVAEELSATKKELDKLTLKNNKLKSDHCSLQQDNKNLLKALDDDKENRCQLSDKVVQAKNVVSDVDCDIMKITMENSKLYSELVSIKAKAKSKKDSVDAREKNKEKENLVTNKQLKEKSSENLNLKKVLKDLQLELKLLKAKLSEVEEEHKNGSVLPDEILQKSKLFFKEQQKKQKLVLKRSQIEKECNKSEIGLTRVNENLKEALTKKESLRERLNELQRLSLKLNEKDQRELVKISKKYLQDKEKLSELTTKCKALSLTNSNLNQSKQDLHLKMEECFKDKRDLETKQAATASQLNHVEDCLSAAKDNLLMISNENSKLESVAEDLKKQSGANDPIKGLALAVFCFFVYRKLA